MSQRSETCNHPQTSMGGRRKTQTSALVETEPRTLLCEFAVGLSLTASDECAVWEQARLA